LTGAAPAEAVLIRRAREACGHSPESAARRCGKPMTGRRWRQIEAGEETRGGKPALADDGRLAHMAHAVRVTPEELRAVGRAEAAEILAMIRAHERSTVDELVERLAGADRPATAELAEELDALRHQVRLSSARLGARELRVVTALLDRLDRPRR
jgi:hypothetical protein